MPCGGIYPYQDGPDHGRCFHCNSDDPEPMLFCEEWDAFLHAGCVMEFLSTPDGQIVLAHKHDIHIVWEVERIFAYPEGR